jgi:hypothetical protein
VVPLLPSAWLIVDVVRLRTGKSLLTIVPVAVAIPIVASTGSDRVTVNSLVGSTVVSPTTLITIDFVVSPRAKVAVPDGRIPPEKSDSTAGDAPDPVTAQLTEQAKVPVRVTVYVYVLVPEFPSVWLRVEGDRLRTGKSSLTMIPVAVPTLIVEFIGLDRVTVNCFVPSILASPITSITIDLVRSPSSKITTPPGREPPEKSDATAGTVPLPVTAQLTEQGNVPLRATVYV